MFVLIHLLIENILIEDVLIEYIHSLINAYLIIIMNLPAFEVLPVLQPLLLQQSDPYYLQHMSNQSTIHKNHKNHKNH